MQGKGSATPDVGMPGKVTSHRPNAGEGARLCGTQEELMGAPRLSFPGVASGHHIYCLGSIRGAPALPSSSRSSGVDELQAESAPEPGAGKAGRDRPTRQRQGGRRAGPPWRQPRCVEAGNKGPEPREEGARGRKGLATLGEAQGKGISRGPAKVCICLPRPLTPSLELDARGLARGLGRVRGNCCSCAGHVRVRACVRARRRRFR